MKRIKFEYITDSVSEFKVGTISVGRVRDITIHLEVIKVVRGKVIFDIVGGDIKEFLNQPLNNLLEMKVGFEND